MIGWLFKAAPKSRVTLYNTATRSKETFEPLVRGAAKMYSCGPTVYNYAHIGNLRGAVFPDILRRTLAYAGYKVTEVMNITDFGHLVGDGDDGEDKMAVGLKREGLEPTMENMLRMATKYADAYKEDTKALNVLSPAAMPRASEHVRGMIAYIETLLHKGFAYTTQDGVYFDVQKFPTYGALGGVASLEHSRVGVSSEKRDPRDFALWKFNSVHGWDAPWGKGFPGWHIECTAMSTQYLGKSFDIHTGGVEHVSVHHNNEIAQAEAANGRPYARFWLHSEHITIEGKKISKSLGNDVTLRQLTDRGLYALSYRYWLLTGHYRSQMNFTWEAVEGAQQALLRAWKAFADLSGSGAVHPEYQKRFASCVFDDLDTPKAVALLWELIKDETVPKGVKRATILDFDRVLGLGFGDKAKEAGRKLVVGDEVPEAVRALVAEREEARKAKDFARADALREDIRTAGYTVDDSPKGPVLEKVGHGTMPV